MPLHASDNDFIRLWSSVASAVERSRPGVGRDALLRLQGDAAHARPAIDALASALAADGRPLVIALDDLQTVTDRDSLRSLDVATELLPANVCLIAITRTLPRLRVARLRAQGRLTEVRAPLLAFTVGGRRERCSTPSTAPRSTTPPRRRSTTRTEGWPAALYLAALWLRDHEARRRRCRRCSGSRRHMHDFLTREVLTDLEPDTRRFLLETSVLPELSGELCDAVLETTGSHDRLCELEQSNLLVVPLGDALGWYRYHGVLRDHLLAELEARDRGRGGGCASGRWRGRSSTTASRPRPSTRRRPATGTRWRG